VLSRGLAVQDQYGRTYRMAGSMTDITERKRVEDQLVYDAFHDSLTGLPNRALLSDRLLQAIRYHKRRPDYQFAVIFLDLDRFKVVNDSLGHAVGDRLLVAIAERLAHGLRALDTIARLGGDEFVVLLEDIRDEHEVAQVADRIQEQLSLPFVIDGQELVAAASMGIVLPEPEIERPEEILRDADIAMYRAKASGKARFVFFTAAMREDALSRLALEAQIRRGLERGEFVAYFQPIISLNGDRLIGFEALVRWQHPGRGVLPPVEFLSIAEDSGLVVSIDLCMLSAACRQVAEWTRRGLLPDHFRVNINLSAKQFSRQELVDGIRNQLAMDDLAPGRLALEITEGIIMEDLVHASRVLDELHSMGLEIQIDDFGTGYSSLGYLASLPIDTLKIDKSFVSTIDTETSKAEIVTTIISLAHNLGMDVIAEGVETEQQRQRLITLGCDSAQGFLFSPPLEADLATRWLTRDFPPGHEALHP
jgi:diguanylate cyclase (GGDEF)-like protein